MNPSGWVIVDMGRLYQSDLQGRVTKQRKGDVHDFQFHIIEMLTLSGSYFVSITITILKKGGIQVP